MIQIGYNSPALEKICTTLKAARKALDRDSADKVIPRLSNLAAFDNLGEIPFRESPLHFHLLGKDKKGLYSIRLAGGDCIVVRPAGDFTTREDGSADLSTVTAVTVEAIGNYHKNA